MNTTKPPAARLEFNAKTGEWEVNGWIAMCVLGPKALVQTKRGKAIVCGLLYNGTIREVKTGSEEKLSGPWVATSKGWVLCE